MSLTIEAVYERGVFRPVETNPHFTEGQRVHLTVETEERPDIVQLAAQVYAGLTEEERNAVEAIALDRRNFFSARETGAA
jgi:predicted DNA-binding antitoxin AbrB/MazE fold protein